MSRDATGPRAPSFSESVSQGTQRSEFVPTTIAQYERYVQQNIARDDAVSRRREGEKTATLFRWLFVACMVLSGGLAIFGDGTLQTSMQGVFAVTVGAAGGFFTGTKAV